LKNQKSYVTDKFIHRKLNLIKGDITINLKRPQGIKMAKGVDNENKFCYN